MWKGEDMICAICGTLFNGYGNNPWPVVEDDDARCCDYCNHTEVVPARMAMVLPPARTGRTKPVTYKDNQRLRDLLRGERRGNVDE